MPRYLPHPFGSDDRPRDDATQSMTWRARRDACRPLAEIEAMSPVRRERALAVKKAAAAMLAPGAEGVTPRGRVEALRIVLGVVHGGDPPNDWAAAHYARERERMRRMIEAGDPKLIEYRRRRDAWRRTPEGRARTNAQQAARQAKRRAVQAALAAQAREAERAAEDERAAWAALHAEVEALKEKADRMGVTLAGL